MSFREEESEKAKNHVKRNRAERDFNTLRNAVYSYFFPYIYWEVIIHAFGNNNKNIKENIQSKIYKFL